MKPICGVLFFYIFVSLPFLKGCFPVVVATGTIGGYMAADKEASKKVSIFLEELPLKLQGGNKKGEITLHLFESAIVPDEVQRGSDLTVKIVYGVSGTSPSGVDVKEECILFYKGQKLTTLDNETLRRKNGKWESRFSFTVPDKAATGEYVIKQRIYAGPSRINIEKTLRVI